MITRTLFARFCAHLRDGLLAWLLALTVMSLVGAPVPAMDLSKGASPSRQELARWQEPLPSDRKAVHLLNRITFGPRPGDVERVREMGIDAFLNDQLHPERIDDSALEAKLEPLATLAMSSEELFEKYQRPFEMQQRAKAFAQRAGLPGQPLNRPTSKPQPGNAMKAIQGPQKIIFELGQEELWRAVYSNRQFQEVMVQFWMNHFNIFVQKGADRLLLTSFERDAIRPQALGKFEDLLVATAESPAMLFYLDNWMSVTPNPSADGPGPTRARASRARWGRGGIALFGRRAVRRPFPVPPKPAPPQARKFPQRPPQRRGLNENYARELMELHTLGVDGGYTQHDVIEVARCFTGWTINRPGQGGGFIFRPQMHDFGQKVVLGHKLRKGRGIEDGLTVLHLLARSPSTAHFISLKLCRRFIADDPPEAAVRRASRTYRHTGGDIRAVLKTILTSPEFYSQAAFRAKVKSPFELVASSLRALGGETDAGPPILFGLGRLGQPMFQYEAPSGYPDRASTWISSGTLLARINFATMLAMNRIPGTKIDLKPFEDGAAPPARLLDELSERLVGGELRPKTREAILEKLQTTVAAVAANPQREVATLTGLVLASPEFQRR